MPPALLVPKLTPLAQVNTPAKEWAFFVFANSLSEGERRFQYT